MEDYLFAHQSILWIMVSTAYSLGIEYGKIAATAEAKRSPQP